MKELLTVIVPAAGAGRRMGLGKNKAFITVRGMPLLILCMKMLAETVRALLPENLIHRKYRLLLFL